MFLETQAITTAVMCLHPGSPTYKLHVNECSMSATHDSTCFNTIAEVKESNFAVWKCVHVRITIWSYPPRKMSILCPKCSLTKQLNSNDLKSLEVSRVQAARLTQSHSHVLSNHYHSSSHTTAVPIFSRTRFPRRHQRESLQPRKFVSIDLIKRSFH